MLDLLLPPTSSSSRRKDEVAASKKDDDLEAGGVEKAPEVPQTYEEGAKNAGEAGETENAVPQAYE